MASPVYVDVDFSFGQVLTSAQVQTLSDNDASFNLGTGIQPFINGGWRFVDEAWAYSSVSGILGTITIPSGGTGRFAVGDWVQFVQSAATKYFQVVSVTSTTMVITGGSDYTLTNSAITSIYHSKWVSPVSTPSTFAYTATLTGFSGTPSQTCTFRLFGHHVWLRFLIDGTSNATGLTLTAPIAGKSGIGQYYTGVGNNNGTALTTPGRVDVQSASTTLLCSPSAAGNTTGWTAANQKTIASEILYEIA